jgi:hypothetical protein
MLVARSRHAANKRAMKLIDLAMKTTFFVPAE